MINPATALLPHTRDCQADYVNAARARLLELIIELDESSPRHPICDKLICVLRLLDAARSRGGR